MRQWQSQFRHGTIGAIDGMHVFTINQFQAELNTIRSQKKKQCHATTAHEEIKNMHTSEGVPQSHFDQLNATSHHLHAIKHNADSWTPPQSCPMEEDAQHHAMIDGTLPVKLTRRIVKEQSDWELC